MMTNLMKSLCVSPVALLAFSACTLGSGGMDMSSEETVAKVKEVVTEHVNLQENKLYELKWSERQDEKKLNNELGEIHISFVNQSDQSFYQIISCEGGEFKADDARPQKRAVSYELTESLPLDSITPAYIQNMTAEGKKLFSETEDSEQYEFKSVEFYRFSMDPVYKESVGNIMGGFPLKKEKENETMHFYMDQNYLKKGEDSEMHGKHIWTNYYTISFKLDDNGKLTLFS